MFNVSVQSMLNCDTGSVSLSEDIFGRLPVVCSGMHKERDRPAYGYKITQKYHLFIHHIKQVTISIFKLLFPVRRNITCRNKCMTNFLSDIDTEVAMLFTVLKAIYSSQVILKITAKYRFTILHMQYWQTIHHLQDNI